jgi:SAM-dependent methyltransferase
MERGVRRTDQKLAMTGSEQASKNGGFLSRLDGAIRTGWKILMNQSGPSAPPETATDSKFQIPDHISQLIEKLVTADRSKPIAELLKFNQGDRDLWVAAKAKTVPAQSSVLDVGAGTCLYRKNFDHCAYKTHDFKQYDGFLSNSEGLYGKIDYVSDINAIPVPDASFDVILCTEVLEHVPEPIEALREMARILKPGGRLFLTAPLMSGLHQLPYHFYSGYTPFWYRHFCEKFGLQVTEISPNGGFFKLLAQECARVAWTMPKHAHLHGADQEAVGTLFGEILPRYLFSLEEKCLIDQFTVGYHVEAVKPG